MSNTYDNDESYILTTIFSYNGNSIAPNNNNTIPKYLKKLFQHVERVEMHCLHSEHIINAVTLLTTSLNLLHLNVIGHALGYVKADELLVCITYKTLLRDYICTALTFSSKKIWKKFISSMLISLQLIDLWSCCLPKSITKFEELFEISQTTSTSIELPLKYLRLSFVEIQIQLDYYFFNNIACNFRQLISLHIIPYGRYHITAECWHLLSRCDLRLQNITIVNTGVLCSANVPITFCLKVVQ